MIAHSAPEVSCLGCGTQKSNPQTIHSAFMLLATISTVEITCTVVIEGNRTSPLLPIRTAQHSWNKPSSLGDINLVYFSDGSANKRPAACSSCPDPKDQSKRGGYAIVFKEFCPGDAGHGEVHACGWSISVLHNHLAEAIAVL